jgi:mRNA interferase MazF
MSTTTYNFGEIVLVQFPFTNFAASKKRPAIVVSNQAYNSSRPDVILMAVTSQFHPTALPGEHRILEWRAAGLLKPSAAKPVLFTLEQSLILKPLGILQLPDQDALRSAIAAILG